MKYEIYTQERGNQVNYIEKIKSLDACGDAIAWLRKKNYPTLQEAWDNCERGDWMLWLLRQTVRPDADKLPFVRVAAACARMSLKHYEDTYPDDDRPRKAIEAVERYAESPSEDTRKAARAAADAADAAAYATAYAANAAIDAANAAYAAARAAANAADAAAEDAANAADAAARAAAYAASVAAAYVTSRAEQAEIARQHFPKCPELGE